MGSGRKRKFNPHIPSFIDQTALPNGIYYEGNRWFVYEEHPEGGRRVKKTVASSNARLSELHAISEARVTGNKIGTITYVSDKFQLSTEFFDLELRTQKSYKWLAQQACSYVLKDGSLLGQQSIDRLSVATIQRLVETIASGRKAIGLQPAIAATPTKANHILRYLRRLFAWGIRHGHCISNPARGVKQVREVGNNRMPSREAFEKILAFAKARGQIKEQSPGRTTPYLYAVMLLAYNVRLRGIEVCTLTDAHILENGIRSNRRKGSRDNVTEWNDALREAVNWLVSYRLGRWKKYKRPIPLTPEKRLLIVNDTGDVLRRSSLATAWQRMMHAAMKAGVITREERFSLHGLKHLGITDSHDKRAGGHRTEAMRQRYDHEIPIVSPPLRR